MVSISIIIPVFNSQSFLKKTLDSVLNQDFTHIEVIVINDASIDNSLRVLNSYKSKDSRVKLINLQENIGPGKVRNLGIAHAAGNYLLFLDSDDFLEIDTLGILNNYISKSTETEIFVFGFNVCLKDKSTKTKIPSKPNLEMGETPFSLSMLGRKGFEPFVWIYMIKKSFLLEHNIRFAEGIFFEDIQFSSQLLYHVKKVKVIRKVLYNYRRHGASITGKSSKQKIDDKFTAFIGIKSFLQEKGVFQQYEKLYLMRFLTLCVHTSFIEYFTLPKTERDEQLDMYMLKIRQSKLLRKENLLALRNLGLSLPKEEKHARKVYLGAYYGLNAIKNRYHMHRIMVRVLEKLNRL